MPTGTSGTLDGTLSVILPGLYTFTFGGWGPAGALVPGQTGYGNSSFVNEFWVGANEAAAEAAGDVFCNDPEASCGGLATAVGAQFSVNLAAGNIPFGFTFGATNTNVITNGQTNNNAAGAYLAALDTTGQFAYLGLADNGYPGDHDFQDLVATVKAPVPEPASLLLLGTGLVGAGIRARRRRQASRFE